MSPAMFSAFSTMARGVQLGVLEQRLRRGQRERPAGADRDQAVLGLDHVAVAGDRAASFLVGHREQRFEPAEAAVGAPVLGQLDRGAGEVAPCFSSFASNSSNSVNASAVAPANPASTWPSAEPAHLARIGLHHRVAERDLAIAADHDAAVAAHGDDGGGVEDIGLVARDPCGLRVNFRSGADAALFKRVPRGGTARPSLREHARCRRRLGHPVQPSDTGSD